jgi:hypothetical protein
MEEELIRMGSALYTAGRFEEWGHAQAVLAPGKNAALISS